MDRGKPAIRKGEFALRLLARMASHESSGIVPTLFVDRTTVRVEHRTQLWLASGRMKPKTKHLTMATTRNASMTELLIHTDGTVFAHNLTPAIAELLSALNPSDEPMKQRARAINPQSDELPART
jgi:hypothetical protein